MRSDHRPSICLSRMQLLLCQGQETLTFTCRDAPVIFARAKHLAPEGAENTAHNQPSEDIVGYAARSVGFENPVVAVGLRVDEGEDHDDSYSGEGS